VYLGYSDMPAYLTTSLLVLVGSASAWHTPVAPLKANTITVLRCRTIVAQDAEPKVDDAPSTDGQPPAESSSGNYDLRSKVKEQSKQGVGFNQFDPVLSATTFVSRRFGLAGGLALVGLLAATEGNEIVKSFTDKGPQAVNSDPVDLGNGLIYKDTFVGSGNGDAITSKSMGSVIGLKIRVLIGDKLLYDTAQEKPIAFRYGKRPFENVLCEGVEQGIRGMRVGGVRELEVPSSLAPKGLDLPEGVRLKYVVEVTEVLPGYF
jgi:hypothetical protein